MPKPRKDVRFTIRMRRDQRRKLEEAAAIESGRRPSTIEAGPLVLEIVMPAVERILSTAQKKVA